MQTLGSARNWRLKNLSKYRNGVRKNMSLCREKQLVFISESIMYGGLSGKEETQETRVRPLGHEDPLEEELATHSSILHWKIPRTGGPGGLQSMGPQRVRHDSATAHTMYIKGRSRDEPGENRLNPILESLKSQNKDLALAQLAGESCRDSYLLNLLNLDYILER